MDSKPASVSLDLEGLNQDEVVAKAEKAAEEQGYKRFSVKKIVKIVYSVELFEPVEEVKKEEEPQPAPTEPLA